MNDDNFLPDDCRGSVSLEGIVNGGTPVVGAFLYKLSVRKTILGFPNAGRHIKNWKRRWFILYDTGDLVYYRHRSELNPDDLLDDDDSKTLEVSLPSERSERGVRTPAGAP